MTRLNKVSRTTSLSEDLRTYFLLKLANISVAEQKAILGQCDNEFIWEKVTEALTQTDLRVTDRNRDQGVFFLTVPERYQLQPPQARLMTRKHRP